MAEHWTNDTEDRHEHVYESRSGGVVEREHIVEDVGLERHAALMRLTQFFWLVFGILEALIGLRIILKLIAANPASPFAGLIYSITDLFLWPFFGLTATPAAGNIVLEIPSIIAMLVYALLAWAIVKIIWLVFDRPSARSVTTYKRDDF